MVPHHQTQLLAGVVSMGEHLVCCSKFAHTNTLIACILSHLHTDAERTARQTCLQLVKSFQCLSYAILDIPGQKMMIISVPCRHRVQLIALEHVPYADRTKHFYELHSLTKASACQCRYVYQKAYVEFFASPEVFEGLEKRLKQRPSITYMAVNQAGDVHANISPTDVNAVTWGVFPAKEVVQPTVVDPQSFSVWKVMRLLPCACKASNTRYGVMYPFASNVNASNVNESRIAQILLMM